MSIRRALLAALIMVLGAASTVAQERSLPVIPAAGPEVFCWLLKNRGVAALRSVEELTLLPEEQGLIVVFGKTPALDALTAPLGGLRQFWNRGGAVLFASDYPAALPAWGLSVEPAAVRQFPGAAYRGETACPLLQAVTPKATLGFVPLVHRLATNRPSYFSITTWRERPTLQTLADFHRDCEPGTIHLQSGLNSSKSRGALPYIVLADAGKGGRGRAMFIAGHGLFTNAMLLQKDNDNFRFADDCLRWLQQGPAQKTRAYALFIMDGEVLTNFDTALTPPPPTMPTPTVELVNRLLTGMEREGFLKSAAAELIDVPRTAGISLVVLTVGVLLLGARQLFAQRQHTDTAAVLTLGPYALPASVEPLVEQRRRDQIASQALGEEARTLVRAWFLEMAGVALTAWQRTPAPMTKVEFAGSWWERRRWRRQLAQLTGLAGPQVPTAYSWSALVELTQRLRTLSEAVHAGRVRFPDGSAARNS